MSIFGRRTLSLTTLALTLLFTQSALGQLRVVTYNTLDKPLNSTDNLQFDTIFNAITATDRNGIAKRVDVIALQEQSRQLLSGSIVDTSENIAARLNSLHGVSSYESSLIGSGTDRVAVVYDSSTVELVGALGFTVGTRPGQRAHFRPVGYTSTDAEFYLYDVHFNASSATSRNNEAINLLANSEPLANSLNGTGNAANFIYAGDFNFKGTFEAGWSTMTGAGSAQALDPINLPSWPNSSVAEHMTQSTRVSSLVDGGATGGLDDRFDLQILTDDLLNGEGLSYIGPTSTGFTGSEHSHHAFGNDGVSWNTTLLNTFVGREQNPAVLTALHDFSDHLPVIADYQLPAIMDVVTDAVPTTLNQGELFNLSVTVENIANVLAAVGADELDYTISTTGDLTGAFAGTDFALGGGNQHLVEFDTATTGMKSGTLTVTSSSLAAENALFSLPITYEVLAAFNPADFNKDGMVDLTDLNILGGNFGTMGGATMMDGDANMDGNVDLTDLNILGGNWGFGVPSTSIPEPNSMLLLIAGLGALIRRR